MAVEQWLGGEEIGFAVAARGLEMGVEGFPVHAVKGRAEAAVGGSGVIVGTQ